MGMGALDLPFDPGSPGLARATAWMLERVVSGELTEEDVSDPTKWFLRRPAEQQVSLFKSFQRPLSSILDYEEALARAWALGAGPQRGVITIDPDATSRVRSATVACAPSQFARTSCE